MNALALICNVLLCAVTSVVVVTEGIPGTPAYAAFTIVMLVVPAFTAFTLTRRSPGGGRSPRSALTLRLAVLFNLALVGLVCWALVEQYPYPEGAGVIPFAGLALLAPVLALAALRRAGLFVNGRRA